MGRYRIAQNKRRMSFIKLRKGIKKFIFKQYTKCTQTYSNHYGAIIVSVFVILVVGIVSIAIPYRLNLTRQEKRLVIVQICHTNKDTSNYTISFRDLTSVDDILKIKKQDNSINIPLTSIENYTIKDK